MIDPELKSYLEEINYNIKAVEKKIGGGARGFFIGVLRGFGSIVGVALALIIAGWILNSIGVIPAFRNQARQLQDVFEQIKTYHMGR